jgi:hypothetical protein
MFLGGFHGSSFGSFKYPLHLAEQYQFSKIANILRKAQGEQAIKAALANTE